MYLKNPANAPRVRGYTPSVHEAAPYSLYLQQRAYVPRSPQSAPYDILGFASDERIRRDLDQPQTVEQIVASGYFAVPDSPSETAIISDRMHTSRIGLDDSIGQLRERQEIHERNVYELELAKCAALSEAFGRAAVLGLGESAPDEILSQDLQRLYAQQREERVLFWRDISTLRQSFPVVAQQYLAAYRKSSVLADIEGDTP